MELTKLKNVCVFLAAFAALAFAQQEQTLQQQQAVPAIEKPEPRQIGTILPYNNWYPQQGYPQMGHHQVPSASQSLLSLLRPAHGGRRSSLTSRLRNLMSALFFRREQSTPYMMASGSSPSYAIRQPPSFGLGGLGGGSLGGGSLAGLGNIGGGSGLGSLAGLSGLGSGGLSSALGSGFGSGLGSSLSQQLGQLGQLGSALGQGSGNPFASASSYKPSIDLSAYQQGSGAGTWSSYKGIGSGSNVNPVNGGGYGASLSPSYTPQFGSSSASQGVGNNWGSSSNIGQSLSNIGSSGSGTNWNSGSQNLQASASSSYPSIASALSSFGSGSGSSSNSNSGSGNYQAAASSNYPSTSYQRSSASFKPVSVYQSGPVASAVSSSSSPSSSSSSASAPGSVKNNFQQ